MPGDIVWTPGHVALYAGNGMVVGAGHAIGLPVVGPAGVLNFALLDKDPLAVASDQIRHIQVEETWYLGRRVYQAKGSSQENF